MSTVLQIGHTASGLSLYAHFRDDQGRVYKFPGSQFVTYAGGDWDQYAYVLNEQGASGFYVGDIPGTFVPGDYLLGLYKKVGATPAEGDPLLRVVSLHYDGTALKELTSRASAVDLQEALDRLDDIQDRLPATVNGFADVVLDRANGVETGFTPRQALRLVLAALAGKVSGASQTEIAFRDVADHKDRIVAQTDAFGNRTAVEYDVSD